MDTKLLVSVRHVKGVSPDEVARLINTLLNVGLSDAADTLEDGDGILDDARMVLDFTISSPKVVK